MLHSQITAGTNKTYQSHCRGPGGEEMSRGEREKKGKEEREGVGCKRRKRRVGKREERKYFASRSKVTSQTRQVLSMGLKHGYVMLSLNWWCTIYLWT